MSRGRPRLALRLEGAEQEPPPVRADVEVPSRSRITGRLFSSADSSWVMHPHVLGRVERHGGAGEPGELGRPQAGGQHRCLAGRSCPASVTTPTTAAAAQLEPGHGDAEDEGRAAVLRALRERERRVAGVHGARPSGRTVAPARSSTSAVGHQRPNLRRARGPGPRSPNVPRIETAARSSCIRAGVRATVSAPTRRNPVSTPVSAERFVQRGVDPAELGERVRAAHLRDEPGRVPRRAARQTRALQHDARRSRRAS